jgi:hypothetical protein
MKIELIVSVEHVHSIFFDLKMEAAHFFEISIAIYHYTTLHPRRQ